MNPLWWETYLLDLSQGFLVCGVLLLIITFVAGALHGLGDDHDFDKDFDHDIDHDFDKDLQTESAETGTPIMLLASTYMLSFGAFGTSLFLISMNAYIRLVAIIAAPVLATTIVSFFWRKVAKSELGEIVSTVTIEGMIGIVVHHIDFRGGSVRVEIGPPLGTVLLPARTLKPSDEYHRGERVTIVERDGNTCIVEAQPLL